MKKALLIFTILYLIAPGFIIASKLLNLKITNKTDGTIEYVFAYTKELLVPFLHKETKSKKGIIKSKRGQPVNFCYQFGYIIHDFYLIRSF